MRREALDLLDRDEALCKELAGAFQVALRLVALRARFRQRRPGRRELRLPLRERRRVVPILEPRDDFAFADLRALGHAQELQPAGDLGGDRGLCAGDDVAVRADSRPATGPPAPHLGERDLDLSRSFRPADEPHGEGGDYDAGARVPGQPEGPVQTLRGTVALDAQPREIGRVPIHGRLVHSDARSGTARSPA